MNIAYHDAVIQLWESGKVDYENNIWLDSVSTKKNFKCSERKRIRDLFNQVFGESPLFY